MMVEYRIGKAGIDVLSVKRIGQSNCVKQLGCQLVLASVHQGEKDVVQIFF